MPTTMTPDDLLSLLGHCTGSETLYRHGLNRSLVYTEGCQLLAEQAGAYWLLDVIASHNLCNAALRREAFQTWTLTLNKTGSGAKVTCTDGNEPPKRLLVQKIPFTDFPLPSLVLWCVTSTILLPSEY